MSWKLAFAKLTPPLVPEITVWFWVISQIAFAFTFESAGTYLVVDPIHVESSKVLVPAVATPKSGGVGTQFTITWSAKSATKR